MLLRRRRRRRRRRAVATKDGRGEAPRIDARTLARDFRDATVAVCSHSQDEGIMGALADMGFAGGRVLPFDWAARIVSFRYYWNEQDARGVNIDMYSWAFDLFEDDVSRRTVLDRLRLYLCGAPMVANTPCRQYFEDGWIRLGEREVFVDGGAHIGDTVIEFVGQVRSRGAGYAHVYSFEPDPDTFRKAVENTSAHPNVTVTQKGLWSSETELTFYAKDDTLGSTFVVRPATLESPGAFVQRVPVTSIDAFFRGTAEADWPTFIKMDIEGAEREALLGAAGVIGARRPKLAISAYHLPDDVHALPKTILRLRGDYRLALRQCRSGPYETVLYAV